VTGLVIDVRLYDGGRIEFPLPEGFTWEHARSALDGLRRRHRHQVARAEIRTPGVYRVPSGTPVLERLDRTLVGAP
jgi:hypothetical protein